MPAPTARLNEIARSSEFLDKFYHVAVEDYSQVRKKIAKFHPFCFLRERHAGSHYARELLLCNNSVFEILVSVSYNKCFEEARACKLLNFD